MAEWTPCCAQAPPGGSGGYGIQPTPLPQRSSVGSAPVAPDQGSRPGLWPGGDPAAAHSGAGGPPPPGERIPCPGARIIARVGQYAILECEVLATVSETMEGHLKQLSPEQREQIPRSQLEAQRTMLIQQALMGRIQTVVIYLEAKRNIPDEAWDRIQTEIAKQFEDEEVERLIKQLKLSGRRELSERLRAMGTSMETQKRTYCELYLAQMWLKEHKQTDEHGDDITRDEMLRYYRQHKDQFTKPARASWEELMASFEKYASEDAAYAAICRMGNEVMAGRKLSDVARAESNGVTAGNGGLRSWTSQGSLVCRALDEALFRLPIGQLSPIIRSANGFHIIRVIDREEAAVTLFLEAQPEIKDKIVEQRTKKERQEYLAELMKKTPIWTIFDEKPDLAQRAGAEGAEMRR
jgi:hypothetical protein